MAYSFRTIIIAPLVILSVCFFVHAESQLTYKEYEEQLASVQLREKTAKEEIAQEQSKLESARQQLSDLKQKLDAIVLEKMALLGITEQDIVIAQTEIASIRSGLESFLQVTPEELIKQKKEIAVLEKRIALLKTKPVSYLWKIAEGIAGLVQLVDQVKSRMTFQATTSENNGADKAKTYTVKLNQDKRECLYGIAGYETVYGDVTKWPYLFRANQSILEKSFEQFKGKKGADCKYVRPEDLIFPGQVLDIPR